MADWLPLFPLSQPLFPGLCLDLQIFEQRYIKLVKSALRENTDFGICAIQDGREVGAAPSIYDCGVRVNIIDWNQLPNGLLGVTVKASHRFLVGQQEIDPDGLLRSQADEFGPEQDEPIPDWASGLADIYTQMLFHPEVAKRLPDLEQIESSGLGFGLAQVLPMPMNLRIDLLRLCSPLKRLEIIAGQVQSLVDASS